MRQERGEEGGAIKQLSSMGIWDSILSDSSGKCVDMPQRYSN